MSAREQLAATLACGAVLAAAPWLLSDFLLSLALSCLMYAALAVSWAMFCGPTHYLSLATSAFFGLGAYVTAWSLESLPYGVAVLAGGLIGVAFAALIGAAVLHLRGAYFAVITFGLGELTLHLITYTEKTYFHTAGRIISDAPDNAAIYWTVLVLTLGAVATAILVRASRLGLALRGIGADEERAQTLGVDTRRVKILAFALSAFFPGALGAAMAVRWTYIEPLSVFNPFIGFQTVLMAMLGGAHTLIGPIVSAVFFSLVSEFLRLRFPYVFLLLLGLLLIALILYLPGGLASLLRRRGRADA
ncbi:MAG: branched-chain amino acid ABC transporter permease [Betaproteobacteria bacterium]|nr:branched-chain amino acid ABC transporter permease [Betaproteobacteria bacterium]